MTVQGLKGCNKSSMMGAISGAGTAYPSEPLSSPCFLFVCGVRIMLINATFNNMSVILVEETGVPTCCQSLTNFYHISLYRVHLVVSVILSLLWFHLTQSFLWSVL